MSNYWPYIHKLLKRLDYYWVVHEEGERYVIQVEDTILVGDGEDIIVSLTEMLETDLPDLVDLMESQGIE